MQADLHLAVWSNRAYGWLFCKKCDPSAALRTSHALLAHHLVPRPSAAETQSTFLTTHRGTLPSSCVNWQADTDWALGDGARRLHRWPLTWLRALRLLHGSGDCNGARRGRVKRSQEIEFVQNSQMDTKGVRGNLEKNREKQQMRDARSERLAARC